MNLREKRRSGNCYRPLHPSQAGREYIKAPAKFLAGAFDLFATTFRLRSCRCRSSSFLVLDNSGWSAQHDFPHHYPVADSRVIDCRRHIWSNGRQTDGAPLRIYHSSVPSIIVTRWRHLRRCPEHEVIRIRRVCNNCASTGGCCLLSGRRARHRVIRGRSSRGLCQRYP